MSNTMNDIRAQAVHEVYEVQEVQEVQEVHVDELPGERAEDAQDDSHVSVRDVPDVPDAHAQTHALVCVQTEYNTHCAICQEKLNAPLCQLMCKHTFHTMCYNTYFAHELCNTKNKVACPLCRSTVLEVVVHERNEENTRDTQSHHILNRQRAITDDNDSIDDNVRLSRRRRVCNYASLILMVCFVIYFFCSLVRCNNGLLVC